VCTYYSTKSACQVYCDNQLICVFQTTVCGAHTLLCFTLQVDVGADNITAAGCDCSNCNNKTHCKACSEYSNNSDNGGAYSNVPLGAYIEVKCVARTAYKLVSSDPQVTTCMPDV
jgi:hypothetical protein